MACPATIWMVMLFPMEATCWKKMTAQYPDRPAQAARACSGTAQLPAKLLQGTMEKVLGQNFTVLGHPQQRSACMQICSTADSVACAPCMLCRMCMARHAAWQGAWPIRSEH